MKKHYIDRGTSVSRIKKAIIQQFDEIVFNYSRTIYDELIERFRIEDIPVTDKGLINIDAVYKIISKGGAPKENIPNSTEMFLWESHYYRSLTPEDTKPMITLSTQIRAQLDEIVFAYSQGLYRSLIEQYNYSSRSEKGKLSFFTNDKLDGEKITNILKKISSSGAITPKVSILGEPKDGYYTSDVEDFEIEDQYHKVLIADNPTKLMSYIASNMVACAKAVIEKEKVDVNAKDENGCSALFYANSLSAISMLINQGADVNVVDNFGNNLLHIWGRKSLLTPMATHFVTTLARSFFDKLKPPEEGEDGCFSAKNHKGESVKYMFLLGSKYFHLSTHQILPDIYSYNSLYSIAQGGLNRYIKESIDEVASAKIPSVLVDLIRSYLMRIEDDYLTLENVLDYYQQSEKAFNINKIYNYDLPLAHRLVLNSISNKPDDGQSFKLLEKFSDLAPREIYKGSVIGNPLDIAINRTDTVKDLVQQREFIKFLVERGVELSEKTKLTKLGQYLDIFKNYITKISEIIDDAHLFPVVINQIIKNYLPLYEETYIEDSSSISSSSSCSSGSSFSFSSSLSSSSSSSCSSSYTESSSTIELIGED